jgi:hypothetical protein
MDRRVIAAVAVVSVAALLPPSSGQGPAEEVARRAARWESDPRLQPFATIGPAAGPVAGPTGQGLPPGRSWRSLHIGLNRLDPQKYPGVPLLEAAEHDAQNLERLARARGFITTVLTSEQATVARVLEEVRRFSQELQSGDLCLITFSGHGGLVPDYNKSHAPRDFAQAFCLYDRMLVDEELVKLWPEFRPGVRVLIVLDSCHSGTSDRSQAEFKKKWQGGQGQATNRGADPLLTLSRSAGGSQPRTRALRPVDVNQAVQRQEAELKRAIAGVRMTDDITRTAASIIRIAGCRSDQVSLEVGTTGLFTHALMEIWDGGRFRGSYRELVNKAAERLSPYQEPTIDLYGEDIQRFIEQPSLQ